MIEPKYRRPLNTEQIIILELLYKFRFVTAATVKRYFAESNPGMNVFRKLERLVDQGYIAKRYFDNHRLLHKPIVYYLLPDGARKLSEYRDDPREIILKGIYRDSSVTERFAMHCVVVCELYIQLMNEYGDDLDFLSKSDQATIDNMPKQKPDAYLTFETDEGQQHYFVDVIDDTPHLLIDASKKIKRYIEYKKGGNWALVSEAPFPAIRFVCNSEVAVDRVQKRCDYLLDKAWVVDISFTATTSDDIALS